MAEYIQVYHDKSEQNRSTWRRHEEVGSLARGILQDSAQVLVVSDGENEKRFALLESEEPK